MPPRCLPEEESSGHAAFRQSASKAKGKRKAHLFGSGAIMTQVLRAQEISSRWAYPPTSGASRATNSAGRPEVERRIPGRRRAGVQTTAPRRTPSRGRRVSSSRRVTTKSLPLGISAGYRATSLGTDGYGLSESRWISAAGSKSARNTSPGGTGSAPGREQERHGAGEAAEKLGIDLTSRTRPAPVRLLPHASLRSCRSEDVVREPSLRKATAHPHEGTERRPNSHAAAGTGMTIGSLDRHCSAAASGGMHSLRWRGLGTF